MIITNSIILANVIALGSVLVVGLVLLVPEIEQHQAQAVVNCNTDMTTCSGGHGGQSTTFLGGTLSGGEGGHTTTTSTDFSTSRGGGLHVTEPSQTLVQGGGGRITASGCSDEGCSGSTNSGGVSISVTDQSSGSTIHIAGGGHQTCSFSNGSIDCTTHGGGTVQIR